MFSETWEIQDISITMTGAQVNGGIGYNFDNITIDALVGFRATGSYQDEIGKHSTLNVDSVVFYSVNAGFRF